MKAALKTALQEITKNGNFKITNYKIIRNVKAILLKKSPKLEIKIMKWKAH